MSLVSRLCPASPLFPVLAHGQGPQQGTDTRFAPCFTINARRHLCFLAEALSTVDFVAPDDRVVFRLRKGAEQKVVFQMVGRPGAKHISHLMPWAGGVFVSGLRYTVVFSLPEDPAFNDFRPLLMSDFTLGDSLWKSNY